MSDHLIASNGLIHPRLVGELRYLDSRDDEQVCWQTDCAEALLCSVSMLEMRVLAQASLFCSQRLPVHRMLPCQGVRATRGPLGVALCMIRATGKGYCILTAFELPSVCLS